MNNIGSTWGKWDFHVHTPYSILNNQFGFNPFDSKDNFHEKDFDNYVVTLFNKAIENNIVAIGITDYFMIEGYKRIKEKYLDCPEKMEQCFPDENTRNRINEIYVFPNIEFRIENFVGEKSHSVNYHVIFSGNLPIQIIEENFIHQLQFQFGDNTTRPLTLNNIKQFGEATSINKGTKGNPYYIGLENITVSAEEICNKIKVSELQQQFLIAIPVDEDLSTVSWTGRDYTTRRKLYYQSDCYMTSNIGTRKWALAEGNEQNRINEFGSLKPCIWGSDAHSYDRMFNPADDRHCWIKAQPSFEGLLQILYEPSTRVMIQKDIPFAKDPHQIIKSISIINPNFTNEPIELNDSLVCIIGGKSTGKSLLLRNIANAINGEYAKQQERIVEYLKPIVNDGTTVLWKDGTTESRRIVYIPQTYLNRTIDNPEKETAIDSIILDVLIQEPEIRKAYSVLQSTITSLKGEMRANLIFYKETQKKLFEVKEIILQDGRSTTFSAAIDDLEKQRLNLASKVKITQEDIDVYSQLKDKIESLKKQKENYIFEKNFINQLNAPVVCFNDLFVYDNDEKGTYIRKDMNLCLELIEQIEEFIAKNNPGIAELWEKEKKRLDGIRSEAITNADKELSLLTPDFELLKQKVEQNEQLKKLAEQIETEKTKLQIALDREKQEKELEDSLMNKRQIINQTHKKYYQAYLTYCSTVNKNGISQSTDLSFEVSIEWKKKAFTDYIYEAFDNRYFTSFNSTYNHNIAEPTEKEYMDCLLMDMWNALENSTKTGGLYLKGSFTIDTVLFHIFDDWYNVHYIVKSGNDTIAEMSPGKKALALLELLISLKDTQCPILIDQPEDDLDNRSIYNDLVRFIKKKKCERQIIVVTHNANVVLGADSEQVIVANQDGKDTPNNNNIRFEYRSGAIEDNESEKNPDGTDKLGILSRSGIQTQICDILEGGKNALELRRNKYTGTEKR